MSKINFMLLISMLLAISFSQLSQKGLSLIHQRKLEELDNEIILLGYDNYKREHDSNTTISFDVHFLFKNWNEAEINDIHYKDITLDVSVLYNTNITKNVKFYCIAEKHEGGAAYTNLIKNYYLVNYTCKYELNGYNTINKINITTNFTRYIEFNDSFVSQVSTSTEALEKDLLRLNYNTEYWKILKDAVLISQSPNSFKIKGKEEDEEECDLEDSENIQLITTINGISKQIHCSAKCEQDKSDDLMHYFLECKSSNSLSGINLNYALLNYTKKNQVLILDFEKGAKNTTILHPKLESKKSSGGLSTGGIVAIVIPSIIVTLGVAGLVFFLSRNAVPPPPVKNNPNTTLGVASSEAVVHQ